MKTLFKSLILTLALFCYSNTRAATSPVAIGLLPPLQFPPTDFDVTGLRLSLLWGKQRTMSGLDFGVLGNITDQTSSGLSFAGLVNYVGGTTNALQVAGLANVNMGKTTIYGLQLALVNYNPAESTVGGFQLGLVNMSSFTNICGLQVGAYNTARTVHGLQIGLINVTDSLHGLQIGLLNFNHTGLFVVSPIINAGF